MSEIKQLMQKNKVLTQCHRTKCDKEKAATEELASKVTVETKKLLSDLTTRKITFDQFKKKAEKIKLQIMNSKQTVALINCTLKKCEKETRDILKATTNIMKSDCKKKDKDACEKLTLAKKIVTKKTITPTDYKQFINLMVPKM